MSTTTVPQDVQARAEQRKQAILTAKDELSVSGKRYYVAANGNDKNTGLSPDTPIQSLARASTLPLEAGDGVFFRRGDLFRGELQTENGVSYGAYGEGEKPKLYGSDFSLADPKLWELYDEACHIWKCTAPMPDCGTLVFDGGKRHSVKLIPSYNRAGQFVCREDESKPFVLQKEMVRDLDLFCKVDSVLSTVPSKGEDFPVPIGSWEDNGVKGDLFLRCDLGNPGAVFSEIEALPRRNMISVRDHSNVCIDNLCLKYIGNHAIGAGGSCVRGLKVTHCEIGWVGGAIQHYLGTDPNYPQGARGTVTRFGNGVEVYGGCDDYEVSSCYIYEIYDAGITHQVTTNGNTYEMKHVRYENNLLERCVYGIEYFLEMNNGDTESIMEDISIRGNIFRASGFGWGQQRHNFHTPAAIKGWSYENRAKDFVIAQNIFDRCGHRLLHLVAKEKESCPKMQSNLYIQHKGGMLGQYGANAEKEPPLLFCFEDAEAVIRTAFEDRTCEVVVLE